LLSAQVLVWLPAQLALEQPRVPGSKRRGQEAVRGLPAPKRQELEQRLHRRQRR
jgi:hypothetical protein